MKFIYSNEDYGVLVLRLHHGQSLDQVLWVLFGFVISF